MAGNISEFKGRVSGDNPAYADFLEQYHYQIGPVLQGSDPKEFVDKISKLAGMLDAPDAPLAVKLHDDSVALNQTTSNSVIAMAEPPDPENPGSGRINYAVFVQSDTPAVYVFSEKITVNPDDGSITSEIGKGLTVPLDPSDPETDNERMVYGELTGAFREASVGAEFEKFTNEKGLALGGLKSAAGEYDVQGIADQFYAIGSTAELNPRTGVGVQMAYERDGNAQLQFQLFRYDDATKEYGTVATATAEGINNPQKYEAYEQRWWLQPGVNKFEP